ncbi:MAG: radical SAM/SPASM domain-containing protein [Candidatus Helarchaeota archaeon]
MRLIDLKLKVPWRITFDTNPDDCNLHCIMCELHSPFNNKKHNLKRRMPFWIIEKVINETAPLGLKEIIPSTMGEPLLYPDFIKIIDLVKNYNLKLNLTTNGTFPRLGVEKWANLILPIASDIKISINGSNKKIDEEIMQGIKFEKHLANIKKLIEIRNNLFGNKNGTPTITFQVTFMKKNLENLPELLKLAINLGADRFKGHHLWITWPQLQCESLRNDSESITQWNKMVDTLVNIAENWHLKNGKKIVLANVYKIDQDTTNSSNQSDWICPFLGREAWIAWDGTFNVCCSPDNLRKKFGFFGNVKSKNFIDLWNSEQYNSLIKNWGNHEVCKACNMKRPLTDIIGC